MNLKGKVAVITGAGAGIGKAITKRFALEGAFVYVTDMNLETATSTASEILMEGGEARSAKMDVLKSEEIQATIDKIMEEHGKIDIWCNNAGVSSMAHVWDMTEKDWDFNVNINAKGVFLCTTAALKVFMPQRYGKFINIASIASLRSDPLLSTYCASKWAVLGFTKTVARECGPFGITCNAICPGPVLTSMNTRENEWSAAIQGITPEQAKQNLINQIPLGRLTQPEDVAAIAAFLASDEADYINGAAITCTGGMDV